MKKLETLGFKHFCMSVGNLPSSYVESLSYYECLLWLIKYLQEEVIPTVNNNSEVVAELQQLFIELKSYVDNYFDNLDVQEEINNKLDEMVESGELQDLLLDYSTVEKVYSTHEELIEDTNLKSGSRCKTLGFYEPNDSGGAEYLILKEAPSTYYEILENELYAQIISDNIIVNQLGAKGDGETDDSEYIQSAIDNFKNVKFINGTYLISTTININSENSQVISGLKDSIIYINSNIYAFNINHPEGKKIENLVFDINNGGAALKTDNDNVEKNIDLLNLTIKATTTSNTMIELNKLQIVNIDHVNCRNYSDSYDPIAIKLNSLVNGRITNCNILYNDKGIYIVNPSGLTNEGIIISNNIFYQNKYQILSENTNNLFYLNINDNIFDFCEDYGLKLQNTECVHINNNYFGTNNTTGKVLYIRQINSNHTDLSINENSFVSYNSNMTTPFININESEDNNLSGLKIIGNSAINYKTFASVNKVTVGYVTNNTSSTSVSPNTFLTGDSLYKLNYTGNLNGGSPIYQHSRLDNSGIYLDREDVKSSISHDTYYKPDNSYGFYINICFGNNTASSQLINLILSKDGTNSLLIGNVTIPASGYIVQQIYVPAGYYIKYNTATPANVVVQAASVLY